jgi:hypothetical protein
MSQVIHTNKISVTKPERKYQYEDEGTDVRIK